MKRLYILLVILAALFACNDYMGKDPYQEIGSVGINEVNDTYTVEVGEVLEIKPTLKVDLIDSSFLEYQWILGEEILSDSLVLQKKFMIAGKYYLILKVTNSKNGMTYLQGVNVEVKSRYANSWLVLSEKDGKSVLSAIVLKKVSGGSQLLPGVRDTIIYAGVDDNVYEEINGEVLGSGPVKLVEHWVNTDGDDVDVYGEILVIQNSGSVELNGETLLKETSVEKEFLDGVYPEGFVCKDAWLTSSMGYLLNEDNRVYFKVNDRDDAFQTGLYQMEPFMQGEKILQITPNYYYGLFRPPLILRERDNKFAILMERQSNNDVGFGGTNGLMVELSYMMVNAADFEHKDIEVLYTTAKNGNEFLSVYRDTVTKQCYVHQFMLHVLNTTATVMQTRSEHGLKQVDSYLFDDFVEMAVFPERQRKLAIIASGNKLYWYQDKMKYPYYGLYHEFEHRIVSMSFKDFKSSTGYWDDNYFGGPHLAVALENGEIYILRIDNENDRLFDVIWHGEGFGNIKDIIYKWGLYDSVNKLEY